MRKLLIIGFVWPEPKSSAAGSRMLQLIAQFKSQGFVITFATTANESENAFDLQSIDVSTAAIKLNDASFDTFIIELKPDVVLFDRFMTEEQFGWRVAEHCPEALRILDTEDFHGLRKGRAAAVESKEEFSIKHLQNDTTKREVASMYRCDLSLMISEAEIDILTKQLKVDKCLLCYLPFLLAPISEESISNLPDFDARQHFITIGNFLHPPNYDAVLYLKEVLWPLIRKTLPEAELHVYGAYESQKVKQLHQPKEGFLIRGYAEDVNEVMRDAKVCLAPLRFGAGLKGKLIDAMQNGTPCVMSSIAAEGMFGDLEPNGFVEDTATSFAKKAVELYNNEIIWKQKQHQGYETIGQHFDRNKFEAGFEKSIINLLENLKSHRQNNFMGQLLMHHSLQSTKYMSKWIEEKNKR
ncbi:glycosyltransferase involved in cell wall biosynthesis [Winogradskyella wandonensis]|uniref:Glycosyltransferase involved in cell wall biosynthesis n=1 Tax=Winogradskyella wandonensis TaxID=1442586 RepID=A0A4V2PU35_9FLAO|nr:glycosyltransferase [Winogradskyella wandonensis]TCK68951.1 glycosyltransferase involved in cell wall biosynthesis [Winogradskyella wandonensis]